MAKNGIAAAPKVLSTTAPPINPPRALATLKADIFAVEASSGAAEPYFITRICMGGTLAKETIPKKNAATTNAHWLEATKPIMKRETIIAVGQKMRVEHPD